MIFTFDIATDTAKVVGEGWNTSWSGNGGLLSTWTVVNRDGFLLAEGAQLTRVHGGWYAQVMR